MRITHAKIVGHWKTKAVWINGKYITVDSFVNDLKAAAEEPGENADIIRACKGVRQFSWGDTSKSTYCLALACCFYLRVKWVMDRFFEKELQKAKQNDLRLEYNDEELDKGYLHSEEL